MATTVDCVDFVSPMKVWEVFTTKGAIRILSKFSKLLQTVDNDFMRRLRNQAVECFATTARTWKADTNHWRFCHVMRHVVTMVCHRMLRTTITSDRTLLMRTFLPLNVRINPAKTLQEFFEPGPAYSKSSNSGGMISKQTWFSCGGWQSCQSIPFHFCENSVLRTAFTGFELFGLWLWSTWFLDVSRPHFWWW